MGSVIMRFEYMTLWLELLSRRTDDSTVRVQEHYNQVASTVRYWTTARTTATSSW